MGLPAKSLHRQFVAICRQRIAAVGDELKQIERPALIQCCDKNDFASASSGR
jgi:hypothetical protein